MSYRKLTKLTPEEKDKIVRTFLDTKSAIVTGATWDVDPAEVIAIHFFHGQPQPDPEPASAERPKILPIVLVRRTA